MGVRVECRKTGNSMDLGYGGFLRWRMKLAELYDKKWYDHYKQLMDAPIVKKDDFYAAFNRETERLIEEEGVDIRIVDFCLQSDCGGSINYGVCKKILHAIGDYDDTAAYTYAAHADHDFRRLKEILQDCVNTKTRLRWY